MHTYTKVNSGKASRCRDHNNKQTMMSYTEVVEQTVTSVDGDKFT